MGAELRRASLTLLTLASIALCSGCATARNPRDPLEPLNRTIYGLNEAFDKALLKPTAKGYRAVVPRPVRGGVTNFFGNFRDVASRLGLEKHDEDFGQTLGRWGMGEGPYLVLPLFGPSSLRDGLGLI